MENCPNCNETLKSGMFKSTVLLSKSVSAVINEFTDSNSERYCNKCGQSLFNEAQKKYIQEKNYCNNFVLKYIHNIPVVTTHSPLGWDYEVLKMVTSQSTTGTGVVTEFTSSFTDFFGAASGRHNKKLKAGEENCLNQLRLQTLKLGGNAVIATDIDYSEIGSGKGILMVCMAGTSIKVNSNDKFSNKLFELITKISDNYKKLNHLNGIDFPSDYM